MSENSIHSMKIEYYLEHYLENYLMIISKMFFPLLFSNFVLIDQFYFLNYCSTSIPGY